MKNGLVHFLFVPVVLVCLFCAESFGQPYVSGNIGVVFLEDYDLFDREFNERVEFSFDPGFGLAAAVGYDFLNGIRTELEIGYKMNDVDKIRVSGSPSAGFKGDMSAFTVMGNVFYDFLPNEKVSPFLGAGIGFANLDFDISDINVSDDDNVFAYQLMAGIAYALNHNLILDVQYRFFGTEKPSFNLGFPASFDEYKTHNILFELRYAF